MSTCFFGSKRIVFVPPGQIGNQKCYLHVFECLRRRVGRARPELLPDEMFHHAKHFSPSSFWRKKPNTVLQRPLTHQNSLLVWLPSRPYHEELSQTITVWSRWTGLQKYDFWYCFHNCKTATEILYAWGRELCWRGTQEFSVKFNIMLLVNAISHYLIVCPCNLQHQYISVSCDTLFRVFQL